MNLLLANGPSFQDAPVTFIILAITALVSIAAMDNNQLKSRLIFNTYAIKHYGQWYRFFSHGLIHSNWIHFGLNAYVFYSFGSIVELFYTYNFGLLWGKIFFVLLYVLGLAVASIYSYYRHINNPSYNALGASGAVSGIVFASILFNPLGEIGIIFLPFFSLPAVVMGLLYLAYSGYKSQKNDDNIGHDAHYWGSIWGFLFTVALDYELLFGFFGKIGSLFG